METESNTDKSLETEEGHEEPQEEREKEDLSRDGEESDEEFSSDEEGTDEEDEEGMEEGDVENMEEIDDDEDDEDGDDDDDEEEDEEEEQDSEDEELLPEATEADDVSSGDENCDRCPICLNRLGQQDIGMPESCDHLFCLECILEWSKNVNTCPVDRQVFHLILAKHSGEDKVYKQFPVENRQELEVQGEGAQEDDTVCEVCGLSDREDRLLLCDSCDAGYHCDCLDPPLASVPVQEWFCPDCVQQRSREEEPLHQGRQIARTRVSERVRRIIADARAARTERRRIVAQRIADRESFMVI